MASATNWLTFSLTPLEMMRSSDSHFDASPHCFLDNFCANHACSSSKSAQSISEATFLAGMMMDSQNENLPIAVPKMEVLFDSQTEPQDSSSLTQFFDQGSAFFSGHQDLKALPGFQTLSAATTNSGSELDDSVSYVKTRPAPAELVALPVESYEGALPLNDVVAHRPEDDRQNNNNNNNNNNGKAMVAVEFETPKKVGHSFGQRTSIYRGVTRHRWTGRYEAHLWDNSCRREGQVRKGRQVYLGGYDKEEKAARAYDLAALKYWGPTATTNFPVSHYGKELEEMQHAGKQEFIASLRRKSSGFSRGASVYRGVTRHHQQGRWQARIGRVAGNKDLYLGTFATEEEAAEAYDIAAIKFRGANAVTNFETSRYDVEAILNSSLPIGGAAKRLKHSHDSETKPATSGVGQQPQCSNVTSSSINFSAIQPVASTPYDSGNTFYPNNLFNHFHPTNGGSSTTETAATMTNATTVTTLPAAPGLYIWPHHQSY